jgi:hypothetical protein
VHFDAFFLQRLQHAQVSAAGHASPAECESDLHGNHLDLSSDDGYYASTRWQIFGPIPASPFGVDRHFPARFRIPFIISERIC